MPQFHRSYWLAATLILLGSATLIAPLPDPAYRFPVRTIGGVLLAAGVLEFRYRRL